MKKKTYFLLLKPRNLVLNDFFLAWFLRIGYVFWKARNHWNWKCGFVSTTFNCIISFRLELSFFALISFDDHVFVIFEKPTLYFFSPLFVLACSKRLPLLKSKTDN